MAQLAEYDCARKIKESSRRAEKEEEKKCARARASAHAQRTSAGSFEREKALSNFQFSQSGSKIRDHAPVMAEVQ